MNTKDFVWGFRVMGVALLGIACDKKDGGNEAAPPPVVSATAAVASPRASGAATEPAASVVLSAAAVASVAPALPMESARVAVAPPGKPGESAAPSAAPSPSGAPSAAASAPPAKPVGTRVSGNHFVVDASAPGNCQVNAECTMTLRLTAQDEYHINKEFPYKFTANDAPGVEFVGGKVFGRANGAFAQAGEKGGVVTVRFRATAAGRPTLAGPFRLSVCSDANCIVDTANVSLAVPIL